MQVDAYHLPGSGAEAPLHTIADRDGVCARAPAADPRAIELTCRRLLSAREALLHVPIGEIIDAIDAATRCLRDPAHHARGTVLRALTAISGYSPPMAELVLDRISEDWRAPSLWQLLEAEFGGTAALEGFVDRAGGGRTRAVSLPLGLHVFSGNVPGVSVTSIVRALLVRSAVLGKTAAGEPVLAPVFARLLHQADPRVGACVAVTYWKGGDEAIEAATLRHAALVVHYGAGDAVASLRSRAPAAVRFVEHGPRVSCAVVNSASDFHRAARDTARATALFDQQGCVSPQFVCVIGTPAESSRFAAALAAALDRMAAELPRGRLEPGEAAAVHAVRTRAEFRAIAGEPVEWWAGDAAAWTVVHDPHAPLSGTCLNRTVLVHAASSVQDLVARLRPIGHFLQTVGVAGFDARQAEQLAIAVAAVGATRVSPIAAMPWPPPAWHHDGNGPLRELVRWLDLET